MHSHQNAGLDDAAVRPKGSRLEERPDSAMYEAAAAGRTDVLGPEGMLRMQRALGNGGASALAEDQSPVLDVVSGGGGSSLDGGVRKDMESRLGADFSDVRVHTDDRAHASAQSVNAHAYTVGSNVVFQRGMYDPGSHAGQTMLAHELTHVIQQRSGPVDGTPTGSGVSVSNPSDRFEREAVANADKVMASSPAPVQTSAADGSGGAVQREQADDEEQLQGSFVQREQADDEEQLQGSFVQREQADDEEQLQGSFVQTFVQRHGDDDHDD